MQITDLVWIDATGFHYADYPSFLAYFTQQYQIIYGTDVDLDPDTQDGQFIAVQAQNYFNLAVVNAANYNARSPLTAQGVGLSTVVKINGLERDDPSFSTVDLLISGAIGTTLTDCVARDTLNQLWDIPDGTTIPSGGTITVTAVAQVQGAINAEANTVTGIFTPTLGWLSVNNPAAAAVGQPVESDAELRQRQSVSTANPSLTVFDGTKGAVENIPGVTASRGYENDTHVTDANGQTANSISMVVEGGDSMVIAQTIALHKTPGCGTYGTTSEVVTDSKGMPLTINFFRPTSVAIQVTVTIHALLGYTSGYATLIKQAVAAVINMGGIGNDVLITKLYVPANLPGTAAGATFDITALTIGKNGGGQSTSNITTAFNELPECDPTVDVVVTVV